jgi:hypothetical protein
MEMELNLVLGQTNSKFFVRLGVHTLQHKNHVILNIYN